MRQNLPEIELSTMIARKELKLEQFSLNSGISIRHRPIPWFGSWKQILQIAAYQKGPDVSEVGNTWLENLEEMHVLRAFEAQEVEALGGSASFLPATWKMYEYGRAPLSIPWTVDTRLFFYRKDLLAKAGISEVGAFATLESTLETLRSLRESGVAEYPLGMSTGDIIIHNLASWVWCSGGDFHSPDGRRITLLEPEAREGLLAFFRLHKYLHPEGRRRGSTTNDDLFYQGKIPVLFSGHWNLGVIRNEVGRSLPEVKDNLGIALPPGNVSYLGGAHLVVWQHSVYHEENLRLIAYLTSTELLTDMVERGIFPARDDILSSPLINNDPLHRLLADCFRRGRTIHTTYRWGAVEVRINEFVLDLFTDLFANPELNLVREMDMRLRALSEKTERTILASW